jgi:hypothetical protein
MFRQAEFETWLKQGGARSEDAIQKRIDSLKSIEKKLTALQLPYETLEKAWETDQFEAVIERLEQIRQNAKKGGQDYRLLMGGSETPHNRLSNLKSYIKRFRRFLAGEAPRALSEAERIRQYVLEHYIEPAREEEKKSVDILLREVDAALGMRQGWKKIIQALTGREFRDLAQTPAPRLVGAEQDSATILRVDLMGQLISREELERYKEIFLSRSPDFKTFVEPGDSAARSEKSYKVASIERVRTILAKNASDEDAGRDVYDVLKTAAKDSPFVRWQTADSIARSAGNLLPEFYATIGRLVRSKDSTETALYEANHAFEALRKSGASSLTYGERINILTSALAMVRPEDMAPLKITRINDVWEPLTGEKLFVEATSDMATDYRRFSEGFTELFEIMRDEWGWDPQDRLDIQGFLWIVGDKSVPTLQQPDTAPSTSGSTEEVMPNSPTNLILYGPPGTGKTYATAFEAVRLCDGAVSGDRAAVMARYRELMEANQIRFVTFHQSYSYEEFVEGLRPETGDADTEDTGTGFSLRPHRGIFREHCAIADQARRAGQSSKAFDLSNRNFFKMSLGRSGGDDSIFDAAIEGGFISMGWGGNVDWSDDKYVDYNEVFKKWNEVAPGTSGNSGNISQMWRFRGSMKPGDIIIVSDGNTHFRAIGEVSGDYAFDPTGSAEYRHSRKVIWHKVFEESLPVEAVYNDNFTMRTCYLLKRDKIKTDALSQFIGNRLEEHDKTKPLQFVLIIDEINRANISKVFGELITLIEPDKRLGSDNALQVRLPYSNELFGVPDNLHIIGTMNTADRSIALLDTALRRRFEFREIMPDPELLSQDVDGIDLQALLRTINERIEYLFDREHQIGHAYFIHCSSRADVDQVVRHKVIPLLTEYFYEDWQKVALVLGDAGGEERFIERKELRAPPGLDGLGDSEIRYRWQVRETFLVSAYEAFQ